MALKPCRECGTEVSTKAKTCPHCGVKRPVKSRALLWVVVGLVGFVALAVLMPEVDETAPAGAGASASGSGIAPAHRDAITSWIQDHSRRQAAQVLETCRNEAGCDTTTYLPESRPGTTFGWDAPQSIRPAPDWAQGKRYTITAGGREGLVYMLGDTVETVYLLADDGRREVYRR